MEGLPYCCCTEFWREKQCSKILQKNGAFISQRQFSTFDYTAREIMQTKCGNQGETPYCDYANPWENCSLNIYVSYYSYLMYLSTFDCKCFSVCQQLWKVYAQNKNGHLNNDVRGLSLEDVGMLCCFLSCANCSSWSTMGKGPPLDYARKLKRTKRRG